MAASCAAKAAGSVVPPDAAGVTGVTFTGGGVARLGAGVAPPDENVYGGLDAPYKFWGAGWPEPIQVSNP